MTRFFRSKLFAWLAFALVIVLLVLTFSIRTVWWAYIDVFFAFMASFINVVAVSVEKINPIVSKMLNKWVFTFCILFIIAFIGEWFALYY